MTTIASGLRPALTDLAALCRLAQDLLASDADQPATDRAGLVRNQLRRIHRRHAQQLARALGGDGVSLQVQRLRARAWAEVRAAIHAPDARVAQAAYGLLHRGLIAAYEKALERAWAEPELMELLHGQKRELAAYYAELTRSRPPGSPRTAPRAVEDAGQLAHPIAS